MALKEMVLFRHAKKSYQIQDPELAPEGLKQAQSLVQVVKKNELPLPQQLICSPKRRAQQTLARLHEELQIPLIAESALDERASDETRADFEGRIKHFLFKNLLFKKVPCVYLCSHLDWLEAFALLAPLNVDILWEVLHLPPAAYYHIAINPDDTKDWTLIKKGQIL